MFRTLCCFPVAAVFAFTACTEGPPLPEGQQSAHQSLEGVASLAITTTAELDQATLHANHGNTAASRTGSYAGDDGSGRVSWKLGGFTPDGSNEVSTCDYGWCGFPRIGSGCLGKETSYGYRFGACNSSAWGQRFAGFLEGVDRPAGSGDNVHADYAAGATGTTTFGYHPYWAVLYNGECRIYQGWSYASHSCNGTPYVVDDPTVCGNGICESGETCSSCESDCGVCPPGPPPACSIDFAAANTGSADFNNANTKKFPVSLQANVTYTFSTCEVGTGDTFLRLHQNSSQVASNDDGCGSGVLSKFTYSPTSAGTYELSAGCYNNNSCSGSVKIDPGDDNSCCVPQCSGDQCGQADGCGGTCAADDASSCGKCGNDACTGMSCQGITYSASSTGSASYTDPDTVQYDIELVAGTSYTISTCDGSTTDTYLRLHYNDAQLAADDDACGRQSSITFTPSTTGTHVLSLGCYSNVSCSGTISVTPDATCQAR